MQHQTASSLLSAGLFWFSSCSHALTPSAQVSESSFQGRAEFGRPHGEQRETPLFEPTLTDGSNVPFEAHRGSGRFQNYLSMQLPFAPAERLRQAIEEQRGGPLKHRGEAHITVITPPEYAEVLAPHVSIEEIEELARGAGIQASRVDPICVGHFRTAARSSDGPLMETWYVVVASRDLLTLRKRVQDLFELRGGTPGSFLATAFEPHITLGFTHRDLHLADGAHKVAGSCESGTP